MRRRIRWRRGFLAPAAPTRPIPRGSAPAPPTGAPPLHPLRGLRPCTPYGGSAPAPPTGAPPLHPLRGLRPLHPLRGLRPLHPLRGLRPLHPLRGLRPLHPLRGLRPLHPLRGLRPLHPVRGDCVRPPSAGLGFSSSRLAGAGCSVSRLPGLGPPRRVCGLAAPGPRLGSLVSAPRGFGEGVSGPSCVLCRVGGTVSSASRFWACGTPLLVKDHPCGAFFLDSSFRVC
ncbi:DUF4573 domain-containing protein [Streptomyces sp. NBC_00280]|uniref:DUF4573 domain-containing protein n=1 Tax=Streptomyces sp. NBC_00280 TaxID=2975699 RepID=UPI00352ECA6A